MLYQKSHNTSEAKRITTSLVDYFILSIGVIFLLLMVQFTNTTVTKIMEALGTGLIAGGLVSLLIRKFYFNPEPPTIKIVASSRNKINKRYINAKLSAKEIDIVGIALMNLLKDLSGDRKSKMLNRILFSGAKMRLMFLSPSAEFVKQRANEDGISEDTLKKWLNDSLDCCKMIFEILQELYRDGKKKELIRPQDTGSFEIRLIGICPYVSIYRVDDIMFLGVYTSALRGPESGVIQLLKDDRNPIFEQYHQHFETMWKNSLSTKDGNKFIVRYYGADEPEINECLIDEHRGGKDVPTN